MVLKRHVNWVLHVGISNDCNEVLTGSCDETTRLWDTTPHWKRQMWTLLSTLRWDAEMARELSHFF